MFSLLHSPLSMKLCSLIVIILMSYRYVNEDEHKQQLMRENSMLVRQVKELQGALQELGTEYQSLQLIQSRQSDRKWDKDRDIIACTNCRQSFNVSTRKVKKSFFFFQTIINIIDSMNTPQNQ